LKQLLYAGGWEANDETHLKRHINLMLKKIGDDVRQSLFSNVKHNIGQLADKDVYSVQHKL
jgi:hypothetical protein